MKTREATKAFNEKKYSEAEVLSLKLLDLAPNLLPALRVLFEIRKTQNRPKAAETLIRRMASLPGSAALRTRTALQLALFLVAQSRFEDALPPAKEAVIATPRDATAQHIMGIVLTETGRLRDGETHYRNALNLPDADKGLILANLAWNLKLQGRLFDAAQLYEQALALKPDNPKGTAGFSQVEFLRGNHERSISLLDEALNRRPQDRTLRLLRAQADLYTGKADAVLDRLTESEALLTSSELCTRGQALDRLGRFAQAIECFKNAKRIQRIRHGFDYESEKFTKKAEEYKAYFTAERFLLLPRADETSMPSPIFLIGFPGSGTSLLEQLLANLPEIGAGDAFVPVEELTSYMPRLSGSCKIFPRALDDTLVGDGKDLMNALRDRYEYGRRQLGLVRQRFRFITDRAASNIWNLGLIKLLFPHAPIVHLLRHPRDVILSNFTRDRTLEGNCSTSFPSIASHYALSMEMVRHYRCQFTLRYLAIRYEDLVREPRALLAHTAEFIFGDAVELPPEETLLANAGSQNRVPAHLALREAVHRRSLYRHKPYERAVPSLFREVDEILAPWVAELGYGERT